MLNLDLRPAKVGNQIRANGQKHGDETVTAFYIPVSLMLTKDEVNELAGDKTWWSRHYDESPSKPAEPLDRDNFDTTHAFKHKLDAQKVRFVHSVGNEEAVFTACTLAKVKLDCKTGGLTELLFEVQTVPTLDAKAASFLGQLNHEVQIEIIGAEKSAKDRQTEMDLGGGSEDEGEYEDEQRNVA